MRVNLYLDLARKLVITVFTFNFTQTAKNQIFQVQQTSQYLAAGRFSLWSLDAGYYAFICVN